MVDVKLLQNRLKFILVQLQNSARSDGRISSDETKILLGFRDMVNDLPNIVSTLSDTANVNVQSNNPDDIQKLLDDLFQFVLGHLMDIARQDDHISDKETELLELIAERLEQFLDNYIKNGRL